MTEMDKQGPPPDYDSQWRNDATAQVSPNDPTFKGGYPTQSQRYPVQQQPVYTGAYQQQPQMYQQPYGYQSPTVVMGQPYVGAMPESHSALAWLTCLFCCWPLGLIAIVKSIEVNDALGQGDMIRAQNASTNARKFGLASLAFGIFSYIALIIFMVVYFVAILPHITKHYWDD